VTDKEYTDMAARPSVGYADAMEFRELSPSYRAMNPDGAKRWAELEHGAITGNRFGQTNVNQINFASLGRLNVPTLVIGGDSDLGAPPPMLRMYAARIRAELKIAEAAIRLIGSSRFSTLRLDFFKRHRARRPPHRQGELSA
jgi:pimeloyl-ACP methyl ester carboxylesterase